VALLAERPLQALTAVNVDDAVTLVRNARATGKKIVFTNGVFDLLHPGHTRYLQEARALGDVLIVGVNSDQSVRVNKGVGRPITPESERVELLEALAAVDAVVVFDEETPHAIIAAIQPDVLVKGADWAEDAIVGRDIVEARGGKVVRVAVRPGYSTSAIIKKIQGR
jgi:D-glycero-beta-D-manno-heptose 1-phosphate adenylyltransferase